MNTECRSEDFIDFLYNMFIIISRQLVIFVYVVLFERKSLPAYTFILKNIKSILLKRKHIKAKQRISGKEVFKSSK